MVNFVIHKIKKGRDFFMAMRNPNGYGAIFKLHGNRRKPWAVVKTVSINTGKQKRVLLGTFEERPDAIAFLVEYNKNPYDLKTKNMTFLDVYNAYYEHQKKKVTSGTLSNYRTCIKFFENISNIPLRELKLYDFQKLFDSSGLAYNSLVVRKGFATSIYDFAIKRELLDKNIASYIEINTKNEPILVRTIFSDEEIQKLWELFETTNNKLDKQTSSCLLIMIYTSLRIGELLELKKENIDLISDIKTIDVIKSKTKAGIRTIPLHDKIIPVMEYVFENESKYLISSMKNLSYSYSNWRKHLFEPLLKKINIVHTPHDCRHTFTTLMTVAGADPVALRQIVGHTGKDITEKIYTHLPIEVLKSNIDLLP